MKKSKSKQEIFQTDDFELAADPKDAVFIQRQFSGKTQRDIDIEKLEIPERPVLLGFIIRLIRYYQKRISKKLGNRCVFDPSCSHYAEVAFRKNGFIKGISLTIKRLYRCRPENGGIDELT